MSRTELFDKIIELISNKFSGILEIRFRKGKLLGIFLLKKEKL